MHIGLANRLALIFSLLVLVATATVGYFVYRGARASLIEASTERLADTADIVGGQLRDQVGAVGEDLRIMAGSPAVTGLARVADARRRGLTLDPETAMTDGEWRGQLADVFLSFLGNRPSYQTVRLVTFSDGGRELGRADRRGEDLVWARRADLEQLAETPLVEAGRTLPRGTLYLSEISLENGPTDSLGVPTLRVALPVYGVSDVPFGLLAIDLDMRDVFARLESLLTSDKALYIANERGELLVQPEAPWSAAAAGPPRGARLPVLFPETEVLFDGRENSLRIEQAHGAQETVVSAYFGRLDFAGSEQRGDFVIGITSPHQVILGGVRQVRTRSFFITSCSVSAASSSPSPSRATSPARCAASRAPSPASATASGPRSCPWIGATRSGCWRGRSSRWPARSSGRWSSSNRKSAASGPSSRRLPRASS